MHGKWETVKNGTDHEASESEGQGVACTSDPQAAQRTARTERYQNIEAKYGGRKNDGQCDYGFDKKLPAPVGESNPAGERQAERQQDCGHDEREFYGEAECLPINRHVSFTISLRAM